MPADVLQEVRAHAAAIERHVAVRGEAVTADVVRELAAETLATPERIRLLTGSWRRRWRTTLERRSRCRCRAWVQC
jgi:hypothetical protein